VKYDAALERCREYDAVKYDAALAKNGQPFFFSKLMLNEK
jgi:hypothetical protein